MSHLIRSFIIYSSFIWIVCHSKRVQFFKGTTNAEKPILLQQQNLDDEYKVSSELYENEFSNHMIFQYDGVNVSSLWRLSKPWSSVEVTMQSECIGFSMEIFQMHQVIYKNDHHRSPDTSLYNLHHGFVCTIHQIVDAFIGYFISYHHDVSVDSKHVKSIKINPIGQQFVKVCYHGSEPYGVFTIAAKESDYCFPLCLITGILLLMFARRWARKINFLYGTSYNVVGILLSPFTAVHRLYKKYIKDIDDVRKRFVALYLLFGGWFVVLYIFYWMMGKDYYYKMLWFAVCIVLEVVMGPSFLTQDTLDEQTTFTRINWVVGITLIFSATRLPEYSILLSIVTTICIKYPEEIYNLLKCRNRE